MGNAINGLASRNIMAAAASEPQAAAPAAGEGKFKVLHGTATNELKSVMSQLQQFPRTAQALVSSRNPDM